MTLQHYATLGAKLNDAVLLEQCGITIEDRVNRPCRITIESALPVLGPEVDARARLGEVVKLSVHIMRRRDPGPAILEIEGPIVAAETRQTEWPQAPVVTRFTVEQKAMERV